VLLRILWRSVLLAAALWCGVHSARGQSATSAPCHDSDVVLRGGKIVTMDSARRTVSALAVREGRIQLAGSDSEIAACITPRTQVVELHGQTVLPGLIDVHTHALEWASNLLRNEIDPGYPKVHSIAEIVKAVGQKAAGSARGKWLRGAGWDDPKLAEHRYITRGDLDPVSPDEPVWLVHVSGHLGVANSAALKLAGITRDTPNPSGGIIEKDASGEPTGILKDNAMALLARVLPADAPDLRVRAAKLASEKALEAGLTTIHDSAQTAESMRAYQTAHGRGWLKVRVLMSPLVDSVADAERLSRSGVYTGFGDDHLRLGAAKFFADGGMGARTIAIYPPAVQGEPDNFGLLIWKKEDLQKAYHSLASAGWQITTHAIGDRAIDEVLDAYQAVTEEIGLKEPRFRIVHCGLSTPAIQKRLRELHVLVDGDPSFVYWIGSWFHKYGAERERWSYPGKSYSDNGIIAGLGSDVPVTPISPWWGIWAAVERRELISGEVLAPEERVSVLQALEMATRNGAYIGFEEQRKGSLEQGKLADFIVIDRDILSVPHEQLKDIQVLKTFVGGNLVYERGVAH